MNSQHLHFNLCVASFHFPPTYSNLIVRMPSQTHDAGPQTPTVIAECRITKISLCIADSIWAKTCPEDYRSNMLFMPFEVQFTLYIINFKFGLLQSCVLNSSIFTLSFLSSGSVFDGASRSHCQEVKYFILCTVLAGHACGLSRVLSAVRQPSVPGCLFLHLPSPGNVFRIIAWGVTAFHHCMLARLIFRK